MTECAKHTSLFRSLINYGCKNVLAHVKDLFLFRTISQKNFTRSGKILAAKFWRENFGAKFWRENFGAKFWRQILAGVFVFFPRRTGTDTGKQHPSKNFYLSTICQKLEEKEEK